METVTSRPSWEDNYPPGSVIKLLGGKAAALLGGLQHLRECCDPPGGLQPSWEFNYTPERIIVFPGRPGRGHGASRLVKCSTYSDTLKINVFE